MSATPARQPIQTQAEAEQLLARIGDSMVSLVKIFQEETSLIKAGRLNDAASLTEEKAALASEYLREIETFQANGHFIGQNVPALVEERRKAHAAFRDILTLNLRVVATAQSVAEGIMRGAADQAARKTAPKAYSADGRASAKVASRPVVLSRSS
jgi:hypothetical protein